MTDTIEELKDLEIATATADLFDSAVGETVTIRLGETEGVMRLVEVRRSGGPIPGVRDRQAFGLIFLSDQPPASPFTITVDLEIPNVGVLRNVAIDPNCGVPKPEHGKGQLWSVLFG